MAPTPPPQSAPKAAAVAHVSAIEKAARSLPQLGMLLGNYWIACAAYAWCEEKNLSPFHTNVSVSFVLHLVSFWTFSAFTAVVDALQWPGWLHALKIQKGVRPTPLAKHAEISLWVLALQVFVALPAVALAAPYFNSDAGPPPGLLRAAAGLAFCVAVEEVGFFYSHWALHSKLLYKRFHRRHHLITAPTGAAAEYAHPVEFLLGNVMPTVLGPMLWGAHPVVTFWWTLVAIQVTCSAHCDLYHPYWPWGDARRHDFHHSHLKGAYGPMGILDRLHGTEAAYTKWAAERDAACSKAE